jgi:hypothetical protein
MPTSHDTPENPSSKEPYFEDKNSAFTGATGTHPVSTNPGAPNRGSQSAEQDEAANSASPDTLGGLVDPNLAAMEDGT